MQRLIFFIHSWLGIVAAVFLLVIGLTGSVLVFKTELDQALAPEIVYRSKVSDPRLSADALLKSAKDQLGDYEILGWGPAREKEMNDVLYVGVDGAEEGKFAYIDPSTGKLTIEPTDPTALFTNWLLALHYTLLMDHLGELIAGLMALVFIFLSLTGFWLYRKFWKSFFTLRWGRSLRILSSDIHKMVGIPSVVMNLILGVTGAYFNISHLLHHLQQGELHDEPLSLKQGGWRSTMNFEKVLNEVEKKQASYQTNWVTFPQNETEKMMLFGSTESTHVFRSGYGDQIVIDPVKNQVESITLVKDAGWLGLFVDSFRPLHFGNFGGLFIQILWCFAGLAPAILAVTGMILFWQRKLKVKKRSRV